MSFPDHARGATRTDVGAPVVGALVLLVAVQQPLWSLVLRLGVPSEVVRVLRFGKEALVGILVVLAVLALLRRREARSPELFVGRRPRRVDDLDVAVAAWVGFVTLYLVVGALWGATLFPRTTDDVWLQLIAYRALVVGPILLLAVRSLRLDATGRRTVVRAIIGASLLLAGVAFLEVLWPGVAEDVAADVVRYPDYQDVVYGIDLPWGVIVQTSFGDEILVTRAGSLLFDYLQLGFFLLPAFAVAVHRCTRRWTREGWRWLAAAVVTAAGVLATVTRSASGAAAVVVVTIALLHPVEHVRRRLTQVGVVALALAVVVAIPTGIAARVLAGISGTDASSSLHVQALDLGMRTVANNPLGLGIGSAAEVGSRTDDLALIVENAYLDIGVQLGVLGMLVFVAFLVVLVRRLLHRLQFDDLALPALAVVAGFAAGGLLLHTWLMIEATWVVYALAGLALPREP